MMRHAYQNCCEGSCEVRTARPAPRFPDLKNRYTIGWRDAVRALLGPATRLHRLRSMRSAMFYDAVDRLDRDLEQ